MQKFTKINGDIITALALIAAGICFVAFPSSALSILLRISGAILTVVQIYKLFILFRKYERTPALTILLLNEGLILICGVVLIINPSGAIRAICSVLGIWLAARAAFGIWGLAKTSKTPRVWFNIAVMALEFIVGMWLMILPSSLSHLIGVFVGVGLIVRGFVLLLFDNGGKSSGKFSDGKSDYISTDFRDKTDE